MKKDPGLTFRIFLMLGDAVAIILACAAAYFIRVHVDSRPYFFESELGNFAITIALLLPIWLIILIALGLYQKSVFLGKSRLPEIGRLLLASALGIMSLITIEFFGNDDIFPVRIVAVYAAVLCFIFLCVIRGLMRLLRRYFYKKDRGTLRAIIIGNSKNTEFLAEHIASFPEDGYRIAGVVAGNKYIPKDLRIHQYSSLKEAIKKSHPDVIFQTDERQSEYVYRQAINHHLLYYFVPSESTLSSHIGQLELIGNTPAMLVKVTPLIGGAKIIKRAFDIILGFIALVVALIPMLVIFIVAKISDPKHPAFYSEIRLTRYNRRFTIYKFRSMKPGYSCMSPEDAFKKMGKPELIKKYRKNGDFLEKDPRITKLGAFLRRTSLDELPQLFNVVKGDISLVGPRALVPGELRDYGDRSLLLSVKSGLTGLAQVSGRRDISFEERRSLDLYYIQNWSIWLDFQILFRTVGAVFDRKGAK